MKRNAINVVMGIFIVAMLGLTACGSGGTETSSPKSAAKLITGMGWLFDNAAPDHANNGSTCFLNVSLYYDESITADDIESFRLISPVDWGWTITPQAGQFKTTSTGKPYYSMRIRYGANSQAFPLAGIWTAEIKLKNGEISSFQRTLHEPGSTADATHQFLYTPEDWAQFVDPSQYIAALGRFPSQGYTVQYSAADGGKITTTGLSAVKASFLAAEPRAYNMYCWLYDANNNYLGYTTTEYSNRDHSSTNLITADGELSIIPSSTISSTGEVALSNVKYIRFIYVDGAQFVPSSYSNADYRSISSLVAVN